MDPSAVGYLEYFASTLSANPAAQELTQQAVVHLSKYWWAELAVDVLKLLRVYPDVCRRYAYDIHHHVLLSIRDRLSPMMYIKILYLTLFHADEEHMTPDGTTVVENRLEVLDGAQACVSSIPSGEAPTYVLSQSLMCLRCIRALLLMVPGDSADARLLIRNIADEVDAQPAHELQPLLLALLARARMREFELTYRFTEYYGESFGVVLFSEAAGLPLSTDELATMAYKAVVAALLSKDVYNFGRLLTFPQFTTCLRATPSVCWLLEWAEIFNRGDVAGFYTFMKSHENDIITIPDLAISVHTLLVRKVQLIALLHMVFYSPADARVFSFDTIAQRCQLESLDDVEPLLMTALAQKILQGTVDGVDNTITITAVQSRVLQPPEVEELANRVTQWRKKVEALAEEAAAAAANNGKNQ